MFEILFIGWCLFQKGVRFILIFDIFYEINFRECNIYGTDFDNCYFNRVKFEKNIKYML